MVEALLIIGIVAAIIVWVRAKSQRHSGGIRQSSFSYTRQPSFGGQTLQSGEAQLPAEPRALSEKARQQAFETFGRFGPGGDPRILVDAAEQFRRACDLAGPGNPRKSRDLMHVCTLLTLFYDNTTELWALNDATAAGRSALAAEPDADTRHDTLVRLGICLYTKFKATKEDNVLAESLSALRAAVKTATPGRPESLASLYHLAIALYLAYDGAGDPSLLAEAVAAGRQAAANPNPLQVPALCQLVRHLRELSWARDEPALMEEAERTARRGVHITANASPEERSGCLFELARTLDTLAHRTGRADYRREAVSLADEAIRCTPDPIDQHLRGVISDGMVQNLHKEQRSADESPDPKGPAGGRDNSPPPPPPPPPPF